LAIREVRDSTHSSGAKPHGTVYFVKP
jgi:hypothetical protein